MALMIERRNGFRKKIVLGASGRGTAPGVKFATRKLNKRGLAFNE